MSETAYQTRLIKKIKHMFPTCFILKNDPSINQGIPDLLILYNNTWAGLELKRSNNASRQPNQTYYIDKFNEMSFASFINPQNEEQVLHDLQSALGVSG